MFSVTPVTDAFNRRVDEIYSITTPTRGNETKVKDEEHKVCSAPQRKKVSFMLYYISVELHLNIFVTLCSVFS